MADICKEIGIPDVNKEEVTKDAIRNAIHNHHYCDMKKELEKSKYAWHEQFSKSLEYFKAKSVGTTRIVFKVCSKMVSEIPENFKSKCTEDSVKCNFWITNYIYSNKK